MNIKRLYFGKIAVQKIGNTNSPAKSESFPVTQLPYSAFQTQSFSSSSANPERKTGVVNKSRRWLRFCIFESLMLELYFCPIKKFCTT